MKKQGQELGKFIVIDGHYKAFGPYDSKEELFKIWDDIEETDDYKCLHRQVIELNNQKLV